MSYYDTKNKKQNLNTPSSAAKPMRGFGVIPREDGGPVQGSTLFPQVADQNPAASNSDYSSSNDQPQSLLGKIGSGLKSYGKSGRGTGDDYNNPAPAALLPAPQMDQME